MGRSVDTLQQICIAHGIQLAVVQVLYPSKPSLESEIEPVLESENELEDHNDADVDVEDVDNFDGYNASLHKPTEVLPHADLGPLVNKVRRAVKIFRKSPTKNDKE